MVINPKQVMLGESNSYYQDCKVLDIIGYKYITFSSGNTYIEFQNYIIFDKDKYPYVNLNLISDIPDGTTHGRRYIDIYHKDDQIKMLIYGTPNATNGSKTFMGIIQTCITADELPTSDLTGYEKYCTIVLRVSSVGDNSHHLYFNGLSAGEVNASKITYAFRFTENSIKTVTPPQSGYQKTYRGDTLYGTDTIDLNSAFSKVDKLVNKFISR